MNAASNRLTVLRVLKLAKPYALPAEQLLAEVNRLVRPSITDGELTKLLAWLKAKAMVGYLDDTIDPENANARKWHIREAGEAALSA